MATARDIEIIAAVANKILNQDGYAFDQIFGRIPLIKYMMIQDAKKLNKLRTSKRVRELDGGNEIEIPVEYIAGGTTASFTGLDVITFQQQEILTNVKYDWKHIVTTGLLDKKDILKASGEAKKIASLVDTHLHNWMKTMATDLNTQLLATSPGATDFHSIPQLMPDDPTAATTIGGVLQSSAANAWWRNRFKDSGATTYAQLIAEIGNLRNSIAGNLAGDKPNLFLTDQYIFETLEGYVIAKGIHSFQNKEMSTMLDLDVGRIKGMDVIWDATPESTPGSKSRAFFINTDYMQICVHQGRKFELSDKIDMMVATQQDAVGWTIMLMGNLTTSNRNKQGVLFDIAQNIVA
jgi:hypothetical protein